MISIKTPEELRIMQKSGKILAETMQELVSSIKPGVSELKLDRLAEKLILKKGGEPGFKRVKGYNFTLCVSTNDQVVHGLPTDYVLKQGDLVGLDCGVFYKGFFTDMAETVGVGKIQDGKIDKFLNTGKKALALAIEVAREGNKLGQLSKMIQETVEKEGYSVVRALVGHGIGRNLHEGPQIPGFLEGDIKETPILKNGMTLAIEVIYNMGEKEVIKDSKDNWTIKTKDGSLSATFEKTIAILGNKPLILT